MKFQRKYFPSGKRKEKQKQRLAQKISKYIIRKNMKYYLVTLKNKDRIILKDKDFKALESEAKNITIEDDPLVELENTVVDLSKIDYIFEITDFITSIDQQAEKRLK